MSMSSSEDAQLNQIITKFYARCMQVILESRIPAFTSSSSHHVEGSALNLVPKAKGSWFNLLPGKFGPVIEKMEPWCRGVREPMVIDVLFSQPGKNRPIEPLGQKPGQGFSACGHVGTVLERWIVQFSGPSLERSAKANRTTESQECKGTSGISSQQQRCTYGYKPMGGASSDHGGRERAVGKAETALVIPLQVLELPAVYKRIVILLRSLYCTARLLPAQSLFRLLCASRRCKFSLSYRILASPPPLPESIKKDMIHHFFTPVETRGGRMCVSVSYRPVVPTEAHETTSLFSQIMAGYVCSAATIQLKQFSDEKYLHLPSSQPSAQKSPSIESQKLRQEQTSNKQVATRDREGRATVHAHAMSIKSSDFTFIQDEDLACPFALDEQQNRTERVKSYSLGYGRFSSKISEDGAIGSVVRLLTTAAPLVVTQQQDKDNVLLLHQCKKTATDALKELKLYIEFRDSILK